MRKPYRMIATAVAAALAVSASQASSHREAPNITRLPAVDATDFYLFKSYEPGRSGYVTVLANYLPLQDPYGGPNYFALDSGALYEIHIDNNGDAREDLTFQFRFKNRLGNADRGLALNIGGKSVAVPLKNIGPVSADDKSLLNFRESYTLRVVRGDRRTGGAAAVSRVSDGSTSFGKPYDFVGTKTFGSVAGYEEYARSFVYDIAIPGCSKPGRVFVGQRDEPFAVNLGRIFDLVNIVPVDGSVFPGGIQQDPANDIIADKNITTLALELPQKCLVGRGNGVIGGWTTASVKKTRIANAPVGDADAETGLGGFVQVSRLSNPLVNEVVIGLPDKDGFNASEPRMDAQFAPYVTNPTLPALVDVLFRDAVNATLGTSIPNLAPSNLPRLDLVTAFLTGFKGVNQQATVRASEMVRLNTGIAATPAATQSAFGVAGGDLAGFPNGRRPGDDVVDLALRVVMGRLCHPLTIGGASVDLGLCKPADAPIRLAPLTDGAPVSAADFDTVFPYLRTPLPGSGRLMAAAAGVAPAPPVLRTAAAIAAAAFLLHGARADAEAAPRYRPADGERVLIVLPAAIEPAHDSVLAATRADLAAAERAQRRHEFQRAHELLSRVLAARPRDAEARLKRANVNLLMGDFEGARRDCLGVLQAGAALPGTICLASAMTGPGSLGRARQLTASVAAAGPAPAGITRWRLMTEADLALRAGDDPAALAHLERAHALDPANEEARTRLAELLHAQDRSSRALEVASGPGASLARLVIRLRAARGLGDPRATGYRREIDELLEVARRRGELRHERERALIALRVDRDAPRALELARRNFAVQKDTADLRLLVDAALATGDRESLRLARAWLTTTGFEDRVADARLREAGA